MATNDLIPLRPAAKFYGIQLSETEHRRWTDTEDQSSQLTYNWEKINASVWNPLRDIMIEVGRTYPNIEKSEVKKIAEAVRETHRMQPSDPIFAVQGQVIEKVGFITDKDYVSDREIQLTVKWLSEDTIGLLKKPIFNEEVEIQILSNYQLGLIEGQFPEQMEIVYDLLPVVRRIEAESRLESAAEYIEKDLPEFESHKEDDGGIITVFYGTNRIPYGIKDGKQQYKNDDDDQLHYGTCDVHLPEGHVQGELERPGWFFPENEHIHVVIKSVQQLSEDDFLNDFKLKITDRPKQHALVFVHGYHTTFEQAARRTAQLAWDIPFAGYSGFYSWPSAGKLAPYIGDDRQVRDSVKPFQQFIKKILEIEELEQIHFIAHSMGSLLLTLTIKELSHDPTIVNELGKIFQIVLGAPDIDKKDFKDNILPAFSGVGSQRTMYASDRDLALEWSGVLRNFKERVGYIGQDIFVEHGIDTVEASNLTAFSRHSYLFESKELLNDIYYLLTEGLPPNRRRLRQIRYTPQPYWLFPK